jgi:uncharacterized protein YjbI with pentapeptide repeats
LVEFLLLLSIHIIDYCSYVILAVVTLISTTLLVYLCVVSMNNLTVFNSLFSFFVVYNLHSENMFFFNALQDLSEVDFSYACIKNTDFSCANLYKAKFGVNQLHQNPLLLFAIFLAVAFCRNYANLLVCDCINVSILSQIS